MSLWHYVFPSFSGRRDATPYWYAPPRRKGMGWMVALAFVAGAGAAYGVTQTKWDASTATRPPAPAVKDTAASALASARPGAGGATEQSPLEQRAARFEELKEVAALAASSSPHNSDKQDQGTPSLASAEDGHASAAAADSDEQAGAKAKRPAHRMHAQRRAPPAPRRQEQAASGDRLVYLYDEIRPNGERVRIYRRANGRHEATIAADRDRRRGFFFEPPWERW